MILYLIYHFEEPNIHDTNTQYSKEKRVSISIVANKGCFKQIINRSMLHFHSSTWNANLHKIHLNCSREINEKLLKKTPHNPDSLSPGVFCELCHTQRTTKQLTRTSVRTTSQETKAARERNSAPHDHQAALFSTKLGNPDKGVGLFVSTYVHPNVNSPIWTLLLHASAPHVTEHTWTETDPSSAQRADSLLPTHEPSSPCSLITEHANVRSAVRSVCPHQDIFHQISSAFLPDSQISSGRGSNWVRQETSWIPENHQRAQHLQRANMSNSVLFYGCLAPQLPSFHAF